MRNDQQTFLDFAITTGALRFGEFVLKSGRKSPYFFDTGRFNNGLGLLHLGCAYAQSIIASGITFDMIYGPAYKGIPLVISTCMAFAEYHQQNIPYAFNRKEIKDHGEGGIIVGTPIYGKVLIIDDVISAGTSVRESIAIIRTHGATPVGVAIALDRQENSIDNVSLPKESPVVIDLPIISILNFTNLVEYLTALPNQASNLQRMLAYQAKYSF